jgi:cyclin L
MVVSMKEFDTILACLGCIFLSSKLEESLRRISEIISVVYRIIHRENDDVRPLLNYDITSLKEKVVFSEQFILQKLGFAVDVECPHKFLLIYTNIVGGDKNLAQKSWNFLNDSILTTLCLEFPAESIACASIYCAASELKIKLPENPAWFELFDVSKEKLEYMKKEIFNLYKIGKVSFYDFDSKNNISRQLPFKKLDEKRKRSEEFTNFNKKPKF